MTKEILAPELAWEPSGHLSEVALSALSDGEDSLLDAQMLEHAETCGSCAEQLGEIALRTVDIGDAMSQIAALAPYAKTVSAEAAGSAPVVSIAKNGQEKEMAASTGRRKVPVFAIAAALVVAFLGTLPSLVRLPLEAAQSLGVVRKVAPMLLRMSIHALKRVWGGESGALSVIVWGLSFLLLATGIAIARKASRTAVMNGGRS